MAKRKKTIGDSQKKVELWLDKKVIAYLDEIARMSGLTANDVLNVVLAMQVRAAQGKSV